MGKPRASCVRPLLCVLVPPPPTSHVIFTLRAVDGVAVDQLGAVSHLFELSTLTLFLFTCVLLNDIVFCHLRKISGQIGEGFALPAV